MSDVEWTPDILIRQLKKLQADREVWNPQNNLPPDWPVKIPLAEAVTIVMANDLDESWRRYQVDYPEIRKGDLEITAFAAEPDDTHYIVRVYRVMREGADRDPGSSATTLLQYDESKPGGFYPWMQDSRAEILEHMPLFDALTEAPPGSTVLVNGLGLGMAVHGALTFPNIAHVDVVDMNAELVDLLSPYFDADRVTFHIGDAHTFEFPEGQHWTYAWHDIWPDISPKNADSVRLLLSRYENRTEWQDAWQREGQLGKTPLRTKP